MSDRVGVTDLEVRLGELVDSYQCQRAKDPSIGVGSYRDEAGELFGPLAQAAQCLGVIRACFDDGVEEIPHSVGEYQILARLGRGVSGVVYAAKRDGTDVALKVMHDSVALDAGAMGRFQREIDVARRLDHPNIVRVLGHGSVGSRLHLAMELNDGGSLAELLTEVSAHGSAPCDAWNETLDRWSVPDAPGRNAGERYARRMAGLFAPTADALAHAHEAGLVHRDLKPGNLLLGKDGRLRITDFGLAKVVGDEMTTTAAVLGTPAFMSPEQASGASRDVDARCDIYGLGATLYRALTLRYPIEAENFSEIVARIVSSRPRPLADSDVDYPPALDRIVQRCLEKAPEDRYTDASALANDLRRCAAGKAPLIGSVPLRRRAHRFVGRRRTELVAVAVVLLVGAVFAAWSWFGPVELEVRVYPAGATSIDGEPKGEGSGPWSLSRGEHVIRAERDGFTPSKETVDLSGDLTLSLHLRPLEPFGALAELAETYGGSASIPAVARARDVSDEPYQDKLAIADENAYAQRLAPYPEAVRDSAYVRLFAINQLLDDKLYPEAYAAAKALAADYPNEPEPLALALAALDKLELSDRSIYAKLFQKWSEVRR